MSDLLQKIILLPLIFCSIFALILLARIILSFLIERSYQRYLVIKNAAKKAIPNKMRRYKKSEETLKRNIEIPRSQSDLQAERLMQADNAHGSYELMDAEEQDHEHELNQSEIVDFVKPVGFWTSVILGQKLTYLVQSAQALNKRGNKGFWVSMIEAKDRVAGKQHGRGR